MEAVVPAPVALQRLAKRGGQWQFNRLSWREIELPELSLAKNHANKMITARESG